MAMNSRQLGFGLLLLPLSACMQNPDPRDAVEGTWKPAKVDTAAQAPPAVTYQLNGDRLEMQSSDGLSFNAELEGAEVPLNGAAPGTTISVRRVPAVAFQQVVKRNGSPIEVRLITVADEDVATIFVNRLNGSARVHAAIKQ